MRYTPGLVYAVRMTPEKIRQDLLEAGYHSEWFGRVLVGGLQKNGKRRITYKEIESELIRFELYLMTDSEVEVIFKAESLEVFPPELTDYEVTLGTSPDGLVSIHRGFKHYENFAEFTALVLDSVRAAQFGDINSDEPVDPMTMFKFGQLSPLAVSEVHALGGLFEESIRNGWGAEAIPTNQPSLEDRLELSLAEYTHNPPKFIGDGIYTTVVERAFKGEALVPQPGELRPVSLDRNRTFLWYPIEKLKNPEFRRFRNSSGKVVQNLRVCNVRLEFLASLLDDEPLNNLDTLFFTSREPVAGKVDAIVLYTKSEPPKEEATPEWLVKALWGGSP